MLSDILKGWVEKVILLRDFTNAPKFLETKIHNPPLNSTPFVEEITLESKFPMHSL